MNVEKLTSYDETLQKEAGGIVDFTQEELLFSKFHHDLGKLGEKGNMKYKLQESEWYRKKQR